MIPGGLIYLQIVKGINLSFASGIRFFKKEKNRNRFFCVVFNRNSIQNAVT